MWDGILGDFRGTAVHVSCYKSEDYVSSNLIWQFYKYSQKIPFNMFNTFLHLCMTKIIPRFRNAAITSYVNLFNTSQFSMHQNWDNLRLIVLSTELFPNSPSGREGGKADRCRRARWSKNNLFQIASPWPQSISSK